MRKIALPTDFSENAMNALHYAVSLFNEKSEFILLHAYAEAVFNEPGVLSEKELEEKKNKRQEECDLRLQEIISEIKESYPNTNHRFRAMAGCGYLLEEVNDMVRSESIDIMVMGTRGFTNDRNITFGTNTLKVIAHVECPVLCIPEGYAYKDPAKLLFPTNFMIPYQKRELDLVKEVLEYYKAELHMLYLSKFKAFSKRQKNNQTFLRDQFENAEIHFHRKEESEKTDVINQCIQELDIDLLVMVNSRHSYLDILLHKSTIDRIGLYPKIPFLVLQNYLRE